MSSSSASFDSNLAHPDIRLRFRHAQRTRLHALPRDETLPEVQTLVPMRTPFLFVDRVVAFDRAGESSRAERQIASNDPVFAGHFPNTPVYPASLQLEMMAQSTLCLSALLRPANLGNPRLTGVRDASFLQTLRPDVGKIEILSQMLQLDDLMAVSLNQICTRGSDSVVATALIEVNFLTP